MTRHSHPVADLFPMMSGDEYADLVEDIREHGLREPIWLHRDGRIIDGRNRYRACVEAGIEPDVRTYEGDDAGLVSFVVSLNLKRRHLNESQRALVAARIANMRQGARTDLAPIGGKSSDDEMLFGSPAPVASLGVSQTTAADQLNVGPRTVQRARVVLDRGVPELVQAVERGEIAVSTAAVIAEADEDVQRKALAEHDRKALVEAAKEIKQAKQLVARVREPEPVAEPLPAPAGRYRCIVIDPPWPMKKIEREERPDQGVELDYPTMPVYCEEPHWMQCHHCGVACHQHGDSFRSACFNGVDVGTVDETCKSVECVIGQQLDQVADTDCHLYLWVTQKYLPDGLRLLDSWGFNYQCTMTWRKNVGITPYSWMYDTEHVLFARRGNLPLDRLGLRLSFEAPVTGHSAKPDVFYERVTQASPGPRIDVFARRRREGFEVWGNEVTTGVIR